MRRYWRYWRRVTTTAFLASLTNRLSFGIFILAKSLRIGLFFLFLNLLLSQTGGLGTYSRDQVVFSFLTFYWLDSLSQLFLRGVYFFRNKVVQGSFDYFLTRPINALFAILSSHTDVQDLVIALVLLGLTIGQAFKLGLGSIASVLAYVLLLGNGFLMAISFHILIVAFILVSLDIDHSVLIYRDVQALARFPMEIYREPWRFLLTFIVPIGVMVFFPVKAFLGLLSPGLLGVSLGISLSLFWLSLKVWQWSLRHYSSASS